MGKKNYKRKRPLDTSSSSSNVGDLSLNKSIAEVEKSGVKKRTNTQHESKELQPTACENAPLRAYSTEDNFSDSEEEVSNTLYNSTGNLCASNVKEGKNFDSYYEFREKRAQSLEGRPWQMNVGSNYSLPTYSTAPKSNSLIRKDFLKVDSLRRLEGQMSRNDFKKGKF